jgi:hypothetical protein
VTGSTGVAPDTIIVTNNGAAVSGGPFSTVNTNNVGFGATGAAGTANIFLKTPFASADTGASATGAGDFAFGPNCSANGGGLGAVSAGNACIATGKGAVALGDNCSADFEGAFAGGFASSASAIGAVALGAGSAATTENSVATGGQSITTYYGEEAHEPASYASNGDCQKSNIALMGQTPGIVAGETVTLLIGKIQNFTLQDAFAYLITIECIVIGTTGIQVAQAFVQSYCLMQVAGVPTIEGVGPIVPQFGSPAVDDWTLVTSISGSDVTVVFTTGESPYATNINCSVRIVKVGGT